MAENTNEPTKAAVKAEQSADPARIKPASDKVREADTSADQHAQVALAETPAAALDPATVETAKVAAPVDPKMSAAAHMAQKFGNDPANPKAAGHVPEDYDGPLVRLTRVTPDSAEPLAIDVHPEMAGDYMRAGWNRP